MDSMTQPFETGVIRIFCIYPQYNTNCCMFLIKKCSVFVITDYYTFHIAYIWPHIGLLPYVKANSFVSCSS